MNARAETWLWIVQRLTALVLAATIIVHLATIIYAVQGGLSAAEILGRTRGSEIFLAFYGIFVLAAAIHAAIGLRTILSEALRRRSPAIDAACLGFAALLVVTGLRAIGGLY